MIRALVFGIEMTHRFFKITMHPVGNGFLRFVDGLVNCKPFGLFGGFEHVVNHRLQRRARVARMVNADAQSSKIRRTEFGLGVFKSVVSAR